MEKPEDVYDVAYIDELVDADELSVQEAGLLYWYDKTTLASDSTLRDELYAEEHATGD